MNKVISVMGILFFLSCAPVIELGPRRGFHSGGQGVANPDMDIIEPDSLGTNIGLNPYLQGYNDGMMTAKNESFGGCLVGGCLISTAGVIAGLYGQEILGTIGIESNGQLSDILCLAGGITISVGSVYMANRIIGVSVPDPMVEDSLYRKGFVEGYRRSYKSRRLNESLKGTAIGVGTTCAGVAALALIALFIFLSTWGGIGGY